MSATPGHKGIVYAGYASSTAFTGQSCSLVSGKTYKVDAAGRRVLDPTVARVWKDSGGVVNANNILSEDLLYGTVTFDPGYIVAGAITLDASFVNKSAVAAVVGGELSEVLDLDDVSPLNGDGHHKRAPTLQDASGSVTLTDDLQTVLDGGTETFWTVLTTRQAFLLQLDPDGANTHVWRGWVYLDSGKLAFDPAKVTRGTVGFKCTDRGTPAANASFGWGTP